VFVGLVRTTIIFVHRFASTLCFLWGRAESFYICLIEINISVRKAIPWLRWVVACFHIREPGSIPGQVVVICCGQFCTWTGFCLSSSVFPFHYDFTMAPYSSSCTSFSFQKDRKKPGRMLLLVLINVQRDYVYSADGMRWVLVEGYWHGNTTIPGEKHFQTRTFWLEISHGRLRFRTRSTAVKI
jgi:hypothetical protein